MPRTSHALKITQVKGFVFSVFSSLFWVLIESTNIVIYSLYPVFGLRYILNRFPPIYVHSNYLYHNTIIYSSIYFVQDISRPTFLNCPPHLPQNADRGTTSATVSWATPTATDNSGFAPNITRTGKKPGERFSAGEHIIRYRAIDRAGNIGECTFKVFVSGRCLNLATVVLSSSINNRKV